MSDRRRDGSKLSFSELDKLRRERKHDPPGDRRPDRGAQRQARSSYRAALEKAFDSGTLAEFAATLQRTREPLESGAQAKDAPAVDERLAGEPPGEPPGAADASAGLSDPSPAPSRPRPVNTERAEKRKLAKKILDAEVPRDIGKAIDRYLGRYGELPRDHDVLEKALVHPKTGVVLHALERLEESVRKHKPRRSRSLSVQLSILEDTHEDDEVRAHAARVRAAL